MGQKQILSDSYHLSTNLESQGSPCGDQSMTHGQICNMVWEPQWACPLSMPKERNLQESYDELGWGIPEWGLHTPKGCGYPTLLGDHARELCASTAASQHRLPCRLCLYSGAVVQIYSMGVNCRVNAAGGGGKKHIATAGHSVALE